MLLTGKTTEKMIFIANTDNGTETNHIWYNDDQEKTSQLVPASSVDEICGDMESPWDWDELESLEQLNAELYGFSFTTDPEY